MPQDPPVEKKRLSTQQLLGALHSKGVPLCFYQIDYMCRAGKLSPDHDEFGHRRFDPNAVDEILAMRARRRKETK